MTLMPGGNPFGPAPAGTLTLGTCSDVHMKSNAAMITGTDIRSRAIAYLKAEGGTGAAVILAGPEEPILRPVGNGLLISYAIDVGNAFHLVQRRHLSEAGLTEDDLHGTAIANLLGLARQRLEIRPYDGAYAVLLDGNFEASLLLADSLWDESLAHLAPNGFVAAAPARDLLAFCDAGSPEAIDQLRAIIARAETAGVDHPLTSVLLRRESASWIRHDR
jgi:hypothetical protein